MPPANGLTAHDVARNASRAITDLTGHDAETVVSIERDEDGWEIGVEVLETRRIPDTADILATYLTRLDDDGELRSYRRTSRHTRGTCDR